MGLDMYLYIAPRYKDSTPEDINKIEAFLDWNRVYNNIEDETERMTFNEWSGLNEDDIPDNDKINFYKRFYLPQYSEWDVEHKHPYYRIRESAGYWRKANQIHKWFVENIQGDIDDCRVHGEVSQEKLIELKEKCRSVLEIIKLKYDDNNDCVGVEGDVDSACRILPPTPGFFFGDLGINEWYIRGIQETVCIIDNILDCINFKTYMVFYQSSW